MQPDDVKIMLENSARFQAIQKRLWNMARYGSTFQSTIAATLIREFDIESPEGDCPENA